MIKLLMKNGNEPAVDVFEYNGDSIKDAKKAAAEKYSGYRTVRVWRSDEPTKPPAKLKESSSELIQDIIRTKEKHYRVNPAVENAANHNENEVFNEYDEAS